MAQAMVQSIPIPTYTGVGDIESYLERLECYFALMKTPEESQVVLLLCGLTPGQYETLRDLVAPTVPKSEGYTVLKAKLIEHYGAVRNTRLERSKFRMIKRGEGESVAAFEVRLRNAVRHCEFTGDILNDNIVEQFISGINHRGIERKLLQKGITLKLADAVQQASTFLLLDEKRGVDNSDIPTTQSGISQVTGLVCFRCGRNGHRASDKMCKAIGKECNDCGAVGHFAKTRFCKGVEARQSPARGRNRSRWGGRVQQQISEDPAGADDSYKNQDSGVTYLFSVEFRNIKETPMCEAIVGGKSFPFVIDSGAAVNIVSSKVFNEIKDTVALRKTNKELYAFGQTEPLQLKGEFETEVCVGNNKSFAVFYVFSGNASVSNLICNRTANELQLLQVNSVLGEKCNISLETEIKSKFPECFTGVGKLKGSKVKLHVDNKVEPVAQPVRRLPFGYRDKVAELLERLQEEEIIESVEGVASTWVSPIVIVPKANDEIRMCIDFRKVNQAIIRERYPIPTMQEMLVELNGATVFSKLDLKQGFFQLELEEDSRQITTFITHVGLFRMKRLGMGISSAPEVFQYTVQKVFVGLPGVLNLADDIMVFGKDAAEHESRLLAVMTRLSESGLTLNPDKCQFGLSSVKFLGHVISDKGIAVDPGKVESIVGARAPGNVSELRGFLGLVQYVGRYIQDLATLSAPLRELTRKSVTFEWTQRQEDSFQDIKRVLSASETLAYFDREAETTVVADAGPVGLGAVLVQNQRGTEKVVAYGHRSLTDVESRYSQTEREALSLVWACEHFGLYLLGTSFTLVTDHKPLTHIFNNANSKSTPRLERWSLRLEPYNFRIVYRPGETNIADPMSRLSCRDSADSPVEDDTRQYIAMIVEEAVPEAMSWQEIKTSSDDCEVVQVMKEAIRTGKWENCSMSIKAVSAELSECDGVILRGKRIFIPPSLQDRVLKLAHEGHQGIVKCKQRLRSKVWWVGLDKNVESMCKCCELCQLVSGYDPPVPVATTEMPTAPWKFCSIDLLGPLPDGRHVVVVIDYYSRFFEVALLRSTKAETVIDFLDAVFARFGFPEVLRTDNGPQFISKEFQSFLRMGNVRWLSTTPLWPRANGLVERTNRSILKVLKIATIEKKDIQKEFRLFLLAYRSTPHTGTTCSPFSLMFGREMRTKLPQLDFSADNYPEIARDRDREYKLKVKEYADRKAVESGIQEGDTVIMKNEKQGKLEPNFKPEKYTVVGMSGSDMVCQSDQTGVIVRRNLQFAKRIPVGPSKEVEISESELETEPEPEPVVNDDVTVATETAASGVRRSGRVRQPPAKLADYLVNH